MDPSFTGNGRVAVVGGGLAGIAATVALSGAGIDVDLFEANQRLGGRVGSFDDPITGESVDYCQHVGMGCCTNFLYLIKRLGIDHEFHRERTLHFFSESGRHLPLRAWPLPSPLHMSGLLLKWPDLRFAERLSIAKAILAMMRLSDGDPAFDGLAIEWLKTRQSNKVIETFWKTILVSALGETIEMVSLRPAAKVLIDGFVNHRDAYNLIVPKRSLNELFDENTRRTFDADKHIQLRLGSRINRLYSDEMRRGHNDPLNRQGVTLVDQSAQTHAYSNVALCVPWYRVNSLLELGPSESNQLQPSAITGIHTWWDKPWMNLDHAVLVNRKCQWVFPKALSNQYAKDDVYYQIVVSAARSIDWQETSQVEAGLREDLVSAFPDIAEARLQRYRIVTDPRSVFSVAPSSEPHRWSVDRFADRNIWIAGDWTDTSWPATMEGAIRSGFSAAQRIANKLGKNLALPKGDLPVAKLVRLLRGR